MKQRNFRNQPRRIHRLLVAALLIIGFFAFSVSYRGSNVHAQESNVKNLVTNSDFEDIIGHYAQASIRKWNERGIVKGDGSNFRPDAPITRGEFAVILNRILELEYPTIKKEAFSDLNDRFYTNAMLSLNENKILLGSDGKLRAEDPITREEAAVVLLRAFQADPSEQAIAFADQQEVSSWARASIAFMTQNHFMNGYDNRIFPKKNITRAEFVTLLDNMVSDYIDEEKSSLESENKSTGSGLKNNRTNGFVIVKASNFQLKNEVLHARIVLTGHVKTVDIEKSEIRSKLVIINNLFKKITIKESKIEDMSSHLKNADLWIDKSSVLPEALTTLKNNPSNLNRVQIKALEEEKFGAPIANNDSDLYEPQLPDDTISQPLPPKKKENPEIEFREDLQVFIEGLSDEGEILLKTSDELSNFELPSEALILNAKNGENSGYPIPLQWENAEDQSHLMKLKNIREKKIGAYPFRVQTLRAVTINETDYKRVKLNVMITVIP